MGGFVQPSNTSENLKTKSDLKRPNSFVPLPGHENTIFGGGLTPQKDNTNNRISAWTLELEAPNISVNFLGLQPL
jgi:hypothetical protein